MIKVTYGEEVHTHDSWSEALEGVIRSALLDLPSEFSEDDYKMSLESVCSRFHMENESVLEDHKQKLIAEAEQRGASHAEQLSLSDLVLGIVGGIAEDFWSFLQNNMEAKRMGM